MPLPLSGVGGTLTGDPARAPGTLRGGVPPQRTLFGVAPRPPEKSTPLVAASPSTLFGVAPEDTPGTAAGAAQPDPKPLPAQHTLLGVVPGDSGQKGRTLQGSFVSSPFQPVRNASTILGGAAAGPLAEPAAAPHAEREATLGPRDSAHGGPAEISPPAQLAAPVLHAKTHLGVAIPGIAPLRPGLDHSQAMQLPPEPGPLDATSLQPESAPASFAIPVRLQLPRTALVLLSSATLLLAAAAAFALLWRGSSPLSAAVSSDPGGKDRIDLVCEDCPDGTLISLAGASAEVRGRKAYLTPAQPLRLGENTLTFDLARSGTGENERVEVTLPPVEYRIRPDTSSLVGDRPRLTLKLEAVPGTRARIGDAPVALDAAGVGEVTIDVGGHLIGSASDVSTFEQAVAYSIQPPSGKEYKGELKVKIGVTPLLLEAPGTDTVTDLERFMLAGRTTKTAEVWVAGSVIPVDDQGRFAQLMSIDSVGETRVTVRASQPGLAPRFASFKLQRVKNLQTEAAARRQGAVPLARVAKDIQAHLGSTVLVKGKVEEVRADGHRTLLIVHADRDCEGRFCLARLVYGGLRKLERGANVTAIGRLQGAVGTAGTENVPDIEVSLLL